MSESPPSNAMTQTQSQFDKSLGDLVSLLSIEGVSREGLIQALTHRSYCAEHIGVSSNERLEFLGDSILGVVVGKYVYDAFPDFEEGALTKLRSSVVSAQILAQVARAINLGAILQLGKGEEASGGREKNSILSDALEAVMGVVYLELGFTAAEKLILGLLEREIMARAEGPGYSDFKSRLQEYLAQMSLQPPSYDLVWSGPDHARVFEAKVSVDGAIIGVGTGSSKKSAEQQAAHKALDALETNDGKCSSEAH